VKQPHRAIVAGSFAVALTFLPALAAAAAPVAGGGLKMALRGDPGSLDCHAAGSSTVSMAVSPAYSTLLRFSPENFHDVVPSVARSWTVSSDGLVYTFRLEPSVHFHDGTLLTSEDVRATFERLRHPPAGVTSVRSNLFSDVKTIRAVDPTTVVFTLAAPNSAMLTVFANPWNCLYSAKRLAIDPTFPAKNVMGSGPFKLVEYTPGNRIVYTRFTDYFRKGLPYLDRLEFDIVSNAGVVPAISGGQIDADFFTFSAPLQQQIAKARGAQTVFFMSPMTTMSFVAFNERRKEFADARVRRALTLAIDRAGGDANLPRLIAVKGYQPVYRPGIEYALPADALAGLPGYGSDINKSRDEARRLLQEAGVPNLKVTLVAPNTRDPFESLGVFLADAWRRIGVAVEIRSLDSSAYLAAKGGGDFDALIDWNSPISTHPIEVLEKYAPGSANNSADTQDPQLVALYRSIKTETDDHRLVDLARQFQQRLLDQAHVAPLFWATRTIAVPSDLRGWKSPPSFYLGTDLAEIWREPDAAK
jgi:peptide/nickel transport system substrate-binding protein